MAKAYSDDLRARVAASAVSGRTCRETAALFGVSVASVVKWSRRLRATGSAAAKASGRREQPRSLAPERDWLLTRLDAKPDLTMRALTAELAERGVHAHHTTVWRIVREARLSFKKNAVCRRAGSARRGAKARALESASG